MTPEQTSIFDIGHHDNHLRDLCVGLTQSLATLTFVSPSDNDLAEIKAYGQIVNSPEQRLTKADMTITFAETCEDNRSVRQMLDCWHHCLTDPVPARPLNIRLIDTTNEPGDDEVTTLVQSRHLRWTTEHDLDVLASRYPTTVLVGCVPTFSPPIG